MTRAALAKLLILVILAFIICLPEFFTLYRASKVNFLCLPYRPCVQEIQTKRGAKGKTGKTEFREDMCDTSREKWEQGCQHKNQGNTGDLRTGGEDQEKSWFMCETDMDMSELRSNTSSSGVKVYFEVSVGLQLGQEAALNLTLFGHSNLSTLHLQPPEEEEGEEEEEEDDNDGQLKAFYCCLPVPPKSRSSNQSHCLLSLSSRTVQNVTAKEELPWKRPSRGEWHGVLRVLWLALLCVVLLAVITTVTGQIYWKRYSDKKQKRQPVGYSFTGQQLNVEAETRTADVIPKGTAIHPYGPRSWSGLSPIQEVDHQDDVETLLDGNVDNCYTVNLHHRGHPSSSSTEEQPW